jgi:hypothetical protein
MARAMLLSLLFGTSLFMCLGCKASGVRGEVRGRPWIEADGDWTAKAANDRVQVQVNAGPSGLFGQEVSIRNEAAQVQVGPLAARTYDGEVLQLQPAKMQRPLSMQRDKLELWQGMPDGRQIRTKVLPGEVTVIEVAGAGQLSRLTLPIRIDGVELLAMDYGWIMKNPGRFTRDRLMTNFVLAEGKSQAVLLGADQSWRFEVDPSGHLAVVATHRAATVRFFVGVARKGGWPQLIDAYRRIAHPEWAAPVDPVRERRLSTLVGRMVLDDWSGLPYAEVTEILDRLRFLGGQNLVVVRHNWQHHGYDVKLPDTWPPNESFGGVAGMRQLSNYCRAAGILFGLHENFIDLYRDAPTFEEWSPAYKPKEYHADGKLHEFKGWYNPATQQQAVRHTPGSALRAMQRNIDLEQQVKPDTIFLDVTSYMDPEPLQTAAGVYVGTEKVLQAGRDLYTQAADVIAGPALGEGCTEKFLGAVQGANCDLWEVDRWGNKAAPEDWEYFPLMDWLARERIVFQGVSYPARYGVATQVPSSAALYERPFLDNYNSTNVLFGHAPLYFLISAGYSADPIKMATMYWLSVPLSEDLGLQRIEEVSCVGGDIHRLMVRYVGGKVVWVNRSDEPWRVEGAVLPQYGYLARGSQVDQRFVLEAGQPLETMRVGEVLYIDFRGQRRTYEGVEADGAVLIAPMAGGVEIVPLGGNTRSIHVDLEKLGVAASGSTIEADLLWMDGSRSSLTPQGLLLDVPPQPPVNPNKLMDVYKRPLLKAVVKATK